MQYCSRGFLDKSIKLIFFSARDLSAIGVRRNTLHSADHTLLLQGNSSSITRNIICRLQDNCRVTTINYPPAFSTEDLKLFMKASPLLMSSMNIIEAKSILAKVKNNSSTAKIFTRKSATPVILPQRQSEEAPTACPADNPSRPQLPAI